MSEFAPGERSDGISAETETFADIGGLLAFHARTAPAAPALLAPGRPPLTYGALGARIEHLVRTLRGLGIAPADRIAIALPRGADSALALIAVASSCACVPVNPDLTADELQRYFSELKLTALLTRADMNSASRDVARALDIAVIDFVPGPETDLGGCEFSGPTVGPASTSGAASAEDDAFILLTSGTAARPKMVPLTHGNVCLSAFNAGRVLSLAPHDRLLNVLPLFHAHGLISGLLTALAAGSSVIVTSGFDAPSFFGWMRDLQPTWYTAVPTIHRALLTAAEANPDRARSSSLRVIRSASASLAPAILNGLEATFGVPVLETYGMTEAASQIAANPFELRKIGSVGRAAGPDITIMDETGRELAHDLHGEIMLRGPNMSRGYYNDEAATQAAFRNGWFRTGDLGYLDANGYLFIVGRIKDVINRGGQKVSPLEVEEVLLAHPAVLEAGVFAIPHAKLGENVAAAVVLRTDSEATSDQLRQFARKRLAAYKVPSLIRSVAALPKGASGKVKRNALADLVSVTHDDDETHLPRTALEAQLAEIWANLLELPQVGVDQDVFALGADSLAVTQMRSRLRECFNVDFSFEDIFDCATVGALAARLETTTHRDPTLPAWRQEASEGDAPLSFQQQRMFVLSRLDPTRYNYNVAEVALLEGEVDIAALQAGLAAICACHEALRSVFVEREGEPVQLVLQTPPRFERIKFKPCPADKQAAVVRREALELAQYPFDLAHEPPLKVTLLSFGKSSHALVVNVHHLVTDGWSQRLFWEALAAEYSAARKGNATARPSPSFQYRDFARWQQSWAQTPAAKEQLDYWRTQLDGVTTLPLRTDRPRPEVWSGHGARHYFEFSETVSADIRALSQDQGVTPFMTLLAIFQCLLFRHTGHADVATGSLIANRNQIESERLIGLFANTLILRNDFGGDPTFGEMLRRVRQVTLDAYRNQDLPIEEVLRALQIARRTDGNPLFRIMFILQNASIEAARFPGLTARRLEVDPRVARFDITLELVEAEGRFTGFFEYATDLFDAGTIEGMADQFKTLLKAVIANPEQRISRLPLLTAAERRRLPAKGKPANFTTRGNLCERFERQAKKTPNAMAISDGRLSLSYRELARRSQAIARWLAREGVGAETVVALLADRGPDLLGAMIAVQRAGAAFLNLDPEQPPARLATILGSSCATVLLTGRAQSAMVDALLEPLVARIQVAELEDAIALKATKPARAAPRAGASLAYLIYTSGSSGAPKGVMIEQRGLSNHLASLIAELGLTAKDVIAQTAPQSFVISVWQFLAGPMVGARVHVCGNAVVQDPTLLAREIAREGITVLEIVPSLLRVILERLDEAEILRAFAKLRLLISTGEPLPVDLCRAWFARCPKVPLINAYGASECSDDVSLHRLTKPPAAATVNVPIGAPLPNTQLYVLDPSLEPQPIGVVGELCIGGAGIGRGYINDPAQNRERFIPDPFARREGARLYRTGDLARRRADGTIECLGRADLQVKVRGYRIELKEIEAALADHDSVRAGIVEPRRDANGDVRLIAHVVARAGSRISASDLRDFLKSRLPGHAIPSAFLFLDQVPLNAHGKVDRSALLAPAHQEIAGTEIAGTETAVPARRFTEKVLSDIWIDLLKVDSLGVTDNFFDLGGHSLLAGQAMARVARALGVSLPIKTIFEAPTIEELARRVDEAVMAQPRKPPTSAPKLADNGPPTLSIAQDQMMRIEQNLPDLPLFNLPFAFHLEGPIDPRMLAQAIDDMVRRHESLRTAFGWNGGQSVSRIIAPAMLGPVLSVETIGNGRPHNNKRRKALEHRKIELLIAQETYAPVDAARAPLLRARLLRLHAEDHILLLTLHHAIADGWSIGVLFEELSSRYAALAGHPWVPLSKMPLAFSDIARWQRWWCGTEAARKQAADWTENLRGSAPLFDGEARPGASTGHHPLSLERDLVARLTAYARQHNATLFMCLLTGLKALLLARTGRTDISVATAMANRAQPDTDRIVGPFENTVIVRSRITPDLSFAQALGRVRQSVLDAHARQELPFNILADHLEQEGIDPAPLLQVYFTLQNPLRQPLDLPNVTVQSTGNVAREGQPVLPVDQTWLSLMLKERPTGITGSCNYKDELLDGDIVGAWMEDLVSLLVAAVAQPNTPLGRLLARKAA